MRTQFSQDQLTDPEVAASQAAIRRCVHCGFCTATCPTYVLLGDERDSPRGRIELIRDMLEKGGRPDPAAVTHVDRCLSCLSCTTTCPSGVDYAQLIHHARSHIEASGVRSWPERRLRDILAFVLTDKTRFRWALTLARLAAPLAPLFRRLGQPALAAMLRLARQAVAARQTGAAILSTPIAPLARVVLLEGCIEPVLAAKVRAAAIRLLTRMNCEVVAAPGEVCCGALSEHLGRAAEAEAFRDRNLAAWARVGPIDAILTTASGCGTRLKAYGDGPPAKDILEFIAEVGLPPRSAENLPSVAYHAACSLQHGQKVREAPVRLLDEAGFKVSRPAESHLCCGSAGVYNILEPELAERLAERKAGHIARTGADIVASGNIGCTTQLAPRLTAPVVHPVELLDWATGGPKPAALVSSNA